MKSFNVKRAVVDSMFGAITAVLYMFAKFKMPIFPSFLEINLSMVAVIICAFMLGPIDASICVLLRFFAKIIFMGTSTQYVGELTDLLLGLVTVLPAGIIYHHTNLKHKTLLSFILVIACWVVGGILTNIFISIPFYTKLYAKWGGLDAIIGASRDALKLISFGHITNVTKSNFMFYYIFFAVIPFNLLLSGLVVLVTAPVHKRLKNVYDIVGTKKVEIKENEEI